MYLDSLDKKECTGCTACASVCAHKAITMEVDNEGFKYPVANHMLCVDCRLCRNSCPVAEPDYTNSENPLVYASYLKDKEQRKRSSSGGLFYAIASKVIEKDGIVYGAIMDENCKVYHKGAETLEELEALRGSKYVQSDMGLPLLTLDQIFEQVGKFISLVLHVRSLVSKSSLGRVTTISILLISYVMEFQVRNS